jgi:large subunit ribosomal protein L4
VAILKKYDFSGKKIGEMEIEDDLLVSAKDQMVKDYIVAIRNNARQWSASTKNRSEVCKAGQKVQPQKGQGKARHGALSGPQFKGGGRVHTPRPKFDQHVKINKKQKRLAISSLISQKIKADKVCVLDLEKMKAPKTKDAFEFFKSIKLEKTRVLMIGNAQMVNAIKSIRNIPKKYFTSLSQLNGYDLALCQNLIILDSSFDDLKLALTKAGA